MSGAKAVNSVIADGRALASSLPEGNLKRELLSLCDDTERYVEELANLRLAGKVSTCYIV